ncbi:MAG TPA: PLP-dependent aminotransferase family protein, partial [Deinococcales bacterium]|nr:PLP-dependent aminotransferase family protein [Deinococcales bacterium]
LSAARAVARVGGLDAGFHVHLELDARLDATRVARLAAERGMGVSPLAPFYANPPGANGLLLGYGGLEPAQVARGARALVAVLNGLAAGL